LRAATAGLSLRRSAGSGDIAIFIFVFVIPVFVFVMPGITTVFVAVVVFFVFFLAPLGGLSTTLLRLRHKVG
jgi:hypothetical protein